MMKEPTVSELKDAKIKLEKDIQQLLNTFSVVNNVTVSSLKLDTYSARTIFGLSKGYSEVKVEIIL